jgi:hypothetical protein
MLKITNAANIFEITLFFICKNSAAKGFAEQMPPLVQHDKKPIKLQNIENIRPRPFDDAKPAVIL